MNKKLLRKKLALMLATLKKKRPFYTEVEYLKSDGLSLMYITPDLSYFPDFEVGVKCDSNLDRNATLGVDGINMLERFSASRPYWTLHASGTIFVSNVGVGTYADAKYKDGVFSVNGVTVGTKENTFQSGTLCLFKPHAGNNNLYKMSIYFFKAWDSSGNLVRDLIPVLDWDMTPCMYDKVSGQLFYNQGTGDFVAGREIHPVEYLESTGTQYIDTGVKGKNNLHYKTKINFTTLSTSGSNGIGGEYLANASAYIGMVRANGHYTYLFNNTAVETTTTIYTNTDYEIDSVMNSGSQVLKVNGETISTGTLSGTFTSTRNIFLYAVCSTNDAADVYGSLKMYYCQIYDNDVLVRDFIPCIDENGTPFMFDRISHTCFLNQGTGAFKYPAREVEYLKSTGTQYILTGFTPTLNTDFELELSSTKTSTNWAMGCPIWVGVHYKGADGQIGITNSSTSGFQQYINYARDNTRITMKLQGNTVYADGVSLGTITRRAGTLDFALFGYRDANRGAGLLFSGSIYKCIIWDNGVPVRDFIPAFKDGQVGMYDKVSGVLKTNTGTGSFTTGKIVEPEYE